MHQLSPSTDGAHDYEVGREQSQQRYLGENLELFDDEIEHLVHTWPTLAWLLEDYGLSRSEPVAADFIYKKISGSCAFEPPPRCKVTPHFVHASVDTNGHMMPQ